LAVRVAERLSGEVVGCDALQVYRGLDAATGKPTSEERARVPHRLIDVVDPGRDYTLADYVRDADAAIAAIAAQGAVPIVVGGTGLYLRGLLKGIVEAPPRDEALRKRVRALAARFGAPRVHRRRAFSRAIRNGSSGRWSWLWPRGRAGASGSRPREPGRTKRNGTTP
jgi:tRNA dimethylallyltransferase